LKFNGGRDETEYAAGSIPAMTTDTASTPDNYDTPWKEAIEHHFPEFMAFYFAEALRLCVATH